MTRDSFINQVADILTAAGIQNKILKRGLFPVLEIANQKVNLSPYAFYDSPDEIATRIANWAAKV